MPSIGQIVEWFWNSLPSDIRIPCNPNNNGRLNKQIVTSLLSPLVGVAPGMSLGPYKNTTECRDPGRLRLVLDSLVPRIDAVSQVMVVLIPASDQVPEAPSHRMDKLLVRARLVTSPDGNITVSLDEQTVAALIRDTFGSQNDDPMQAPPTVRAFNRILTNERRVVELEERLAKGWAERRLPDAAALPDTSAATRELLCASEEDWETRYRSYRSLEPWWTLAVHPYGGNLTQEQVLLRPGLCDKVDQDLELPLDRTVADRIRKRFEYKQNKGDESFQTHPRYRGSSTHSVVEMAVDHACDPLGLPDRDAQTMFTIGVWMDASLDDLSVDGFFPKKYRAVADRFDRMQRANRDLGQRMSIRLWSCLYGKILFANEVPTDPDTVVRELSSARQDLRDNNQLVTFSTEPTIVDGWAAPESRPEVPNAELISVMSALSAVLTDADTLKAPCDVTRYLRSLGKQGTPRTEKKRANCWQAIIEWQHQLRHEVAFYPSYEQVCAFIRRQWAVTGEENNDNV